MSIVQHEFNRQRLIVVLAAFAVIVSYLFWIRRHLLPPPDRTTNLSVEPSKIPAVDPFVLVFIDEKAEARL